MNIGALYEIKMESIAMFLQPMGKLAGSFIQKTKICSRVALRK